MSKKKVSASELYSIYARRALGMDEPWRWYSLEFKEGPPGTKGYTLLKGGMPGPPVKSGPRKGEANWRARDKSWDRELVIPNEEIERLDKELNPPEPQP